jgi:hypothetical protein
MIEPKIDDFNAEMTEKVQVYDEKEIVNIPRPFSKEPVQSLQEQIEQPEEIYEEEPEPKRDPKKAKLGAKITVFSIDTAIQTILTIVAKSDIPGATDEEKKELTEIWEEYYLETGKEPPLWLMLVTMNVSVYGDKVYNAVKKRKENLQGTENEIEETNQAPIFEFTPRANRLKRDPINEQPEPEKYAVGDIPMENIAKRTPEPTPETTPEPKPEPTPEENKEPLIIREGPQEIIQETVLVCQNIGCNTELKGKQKSFCSIKCRNEYINEKRKK